MKRLLLIITVVILTVSFAACNSDVPANESSINPPSSSETASLPIASSVPEESLPLPEPSTPDESLPEEPELSLPEASDTYDDDQPECISPSDFQYFNIRTYTIDKAADFFKSFNLNEFRDGIDESKGEYANKFGECINAILDEGKIIKPSYKGEVFRLDEMIYKFTGKFYMLYYYTGNDFNIHVQVADNKAMVDLAKKHGIDAYRSAFENDGIPLSKVTSDDLAKDGCLSMEPVKVNYYDKEIDAVKYRPISWLRCLYVRFMHDDKIITISYYPHIKTYEDQEYDLGKLYPPIELDYYKLG